MLLRILRPITWDDQEYPTTPHVDHLQYKNKQTNFWDRREKETHHINSGPTATALDVSHHHARVADEVLHLHPSWASDIHKDRDADYERGGEYCWCWWYWDQICSPHVRKLFCLDTAERCLRNVESYSNRQFMDGKEVVKYLYDVEHDVHGTDLSVKGIPGHVIRA